MKPIYRSLLLCFFTFSVLLATSALADDSGSPTTSTITQPDGTIITTITKLDGTTITKINKIDGTMISTINNPDGSSIKTIDNPDGSSIKTVYNKDGSWNRTAIGLDGTITGYTSSSTVDTGSSSSPTPDNGSSPTPSPEDAPTPTPTPSTPLVAPFNIDMVPVWMAEKEDKTHLFLISSSCITADQYVAFLNAVAKYTDNHGLYYSSMGDQPKSKTDFHGNKITPKTPQIIRTLSQDKKGFTYSVVNRDQSANIFGAPEITNKDLPITYVNLFDAARFCNWLHHGEPIIGEGENSDDVTEGGAYLIADGFNPQFKRYEEIRTSITLLPTALWRLPSYYAYNGVHHASGKNTNTPDFTEVGGELSNQSVPFNEVNGFFDNYPNIWSWEYAHYELTATHHCFCVNALRSYSCKPESYGNYYKVKSPKDEKEDFAEPTTINVMTHIKSASKDNDTSFRVMPLGYVSDSSPTPDASPEPASTPDPSPTLN